MLSREAVTDFAAQKSETRKARENGGGEWGRRG
jgi:hypothetical protein